MSNFYGQFFLFLALDLLVKWFLLLESGHFLTLEITLKYIIFRSLLFYHCAWTFIFSTLFLYTSFSRVSLVYFSPIFSAFSSPYFFSQFLQEIFLSWISFDVSTWGRWSPSGLKCFCSIIMCRIVYFLFIKLMGILLKNIISQINICLSLIQNFIHIFYYLILFNVRIHGIYIS